MTDPICYFEFHNHQRVQINALETVGVVIERADRGGACNEFLVAYYWEGQRRTEWMRPFELADDESIGVYSVESVEARERILTARIAELEKQLDIADKRAGTANHYRGLMAKQKSKYVYMLALAELAASGNELALACIMPCSKVVRDPTKSLKDVKAMAWVSSNHVFGKTSDPYGDLKSNG